MPSRANCLLGKWENLDLVNYNPTSPLGLGFFEVIFYLSTTSALKKSFKNKSTKCFIINVEGKEEKILFNSTNIYFLHRRILML